jgi:hypothetical protein
MSASETAPTPAEWYTWVANAGGGVEFKELSSLASHAACARFRVGRFPERR